MGSQELIVGGMALVWLILAVLVVGYPLVTGRMRVGAPNSTPVSRSEDPAGFWVAFALSSGSFFVVSGVAAWVASRILKS